MYKLLIADDEPLEREALRLFVEESNLEIERVFECANGNDAIRICLLEKPDIVLLDINMPGMSGLEVLDRIRIADKKSKVIISSAYDYFEYAKKALQLGAMDFLVKPVKQGVLVSALNKAVDVLDAEADAENRFSRMADMLESMGSRVAADLAGGSISDEDLYYLDTMGLRPETSGTTFHIRTDPGLSRKKTPDAAREIKSMLSFLDISVICSAKDDRLTLIVFAKGASDNAALFEKIRSLLESALPGSGAGRGIGMGTLFENIEEIRRSYAHARKEAGDPAPQPETDLPDRDIPVEISKLRRFIELNYSRKIGLDDIAEAVGVSKFHICRLFKQNTGTTIVDYLVGRRIEKAKELLKDGNYSIKQISGMVGYSDPNYFTWTFKKTEGVSPVKYRYANS